MSHPAVARMRSAVKAHLQEVSDGYSHNVAAAEHDCSLAADGHAVPPEQLQTALQRKQMLLVADQKQ